MKAEKDTAVAAERSRGPDILLNPEPGASVTVSSLDSGRLRLHRPLWSCEAGEQGLPWPRPRQPGGNLLRSCGFGSLRVPTWGPGRYQQGRALDLRRASGRVTRGPAGAEARRIKGPATLQQTRPNHFNFSRSLQLSASAHGGGPPLLTGPAVRHKEIAQGEQQRCGAPGGAEAVAAPAPPPLKALGSSLLPPAPLPLLCPSDQRPQK
ncbi:hypothetical protein AAFF_G00036480 [Aldrovandia affinis]|uniref:Uncharacterized protein n=1 Tax=Aldrovandia affinis TaxID=143900 RepID=A0AAD7S3A1_9TELE|nr:hypothetical protein AAFF_G00036480 [Aldrovandia affinis]